MAKDDGVINSSDNSDRTGKSVGSGPVGGKADRNIGGTDGPTDTYGKDPMKLLKDSIKRVGDNYPHNKG
jgi:hypothetical protein